MKVERTGCRGGGCGRRSCSHAQRSRAGDVAFEVIDFCLLEVELCGDVGWIREGRRRRPDERTRDPRVRGQLSSDGYSHGGVSAKSRASSWARSVVLCVVTVSGRVSVGAGWRAGVAVAAAVPVTEVAAVGDVPSVSPSAVRRTQKSSERVSSSGKRSMISVMGIHGTRGISKGYSGGLDSLVLYFDKNTII